MNDREPRTTARLLALLGALAFGTLGFGAVAGCETTEGAEEDLEELGEEIDEEF